MQELTQSSQARKEILEERLISLKKDIAASLVQWKTTLSEVDRSRLGDLMDMRSDQMKQVETELNELGEPDFDCQY
jgi:flagellar motor switch protein FliM